MSDDVRKLFQKRKINPDVIRVAEEKQKQRIAEVKDIKARADTKYETDEEKYYREKEKNSPKHYECKSCGLKMSGETMFHSQKYGCPSCAQVNKGYNYSSVPFNE